MKHENDDSAMANMWSWTWWLWPNCVCVADMVTDELWEWLYLQQDKDTSEQGTSIVDDEDGHLIYQAGDLLQARCTSIFVMF